MKPDFENYLQQARTEFCLVAHKYDVTHHGELRTAIDSLLIAYDQMFLALSKHNVSGKRPSLQEVKDNIANIQGFDSWETCFNQHILQAAVPELMDLLAIHYQAACASGAVDKTVSDGFSCSECNGIDGHRRNCPEFIR